MSSSDVRDVLNLPDGAAASAAAAEGRPTKKQRLSLQRPNLKGLAREVHNLGGDNPIAIVPQTTQFKKRRLASRKPAARWELKAFRNSARADESLVLRHWRRADLKPDDGQPALRDAVVTPGMMEQQHQQHQHQHQQQEGQAGNEKKEEEGDRPIKMEEIEDSSFAKFNVQVPVPQYSDDQYQQTLQNDGWTKQETDYLMELCKDYDLRWPLIWDRYEWNPPAMNGETNEDGDETKAIVPTSQARSMEALKARYYEVAAKMMVVQKPVQYMTSQEFALHELMAHFNPAQEKARKDFATTSLSRSRDEAREEESLLLEVKRILARSDRFNEERKELYDRLDYPHADTDISSFKSSTGLQTLLANLMNIDKSRKRRPIMGPDGNSPNPAANQAAAPPEPQSRRESTAASTGRRDSTSVPTPAPAATKKGEKQQQQQQQQQQQPTERKKLTEQEEAIYGVTHHDRLGSGPTFRTEKINKLFSHKSNQQQMRINNALNELDVPAKLAMPTAATTQQYEQLLVAVNSLLDARKVTDKLDAEIKLEQAKKAEREKALAPPVAEEDDKKAEGEKGEAPDEAGEPAKADKAEASKPAEEKSSSEEGNKAESGGNAEAKGEEDKGKDDKESGNPGNKRSASVLSSVSDKSAKRQKK
ncbi:hypothetical protein N3K66_004530 [Trichothecium roseum]|uniref:Uncharacterized protein n=1 Tax=Trichothecium roseum TaxID=47278 RepID=A0ACC0V374_9HYPO|nr:hypothetical protein N3K66_004530 [Trichothecium roseum]